VNGQLPAPADSFPGIRALVERSGLCGDEESLLPLEVIETRYFGCPSRDLVAIPTELFRPPNTDCVKTITYSPVVGLHVTQDSPTCSAI
jgi:hypothetical protein